MATRGVTLSPLVLGLIRGGPIWPSRPCTRIQLDGNSSSWYFVWVCTLRCAGHPWLQWSEHIREINNFFIYYLDSQIPSEDERRANVPKKEGTRAKRCRNTFTLRAGQTKFMGREPQAIAIAGSKENDGIRGRRCSRPRITLKTRDLR